VHEHKRRCEDFRSGQQSLYLSAISQDKAEPHPPARSSFCGVFGVIDKSLLAIFRTRVIRRPRFWCACHHIGDNCPISSAVLIPTFGKIKALSPATSVKSPLCSFHGGDVFPPESAKSALGPRALARRWWGKRQASDRSCGGCFFGVLAACSSSAFSPAPQTIRSWVRGHRWNVDFLDQRMRRKIGPRRPSRGWITSRVAVDQRFRRPAAARVSSR